MPRPENGSRRRWEGVAGRGREAVVDGRSGGTVEEGGTKEWVQRDLDLVQLPRATGSLRVVGGGKHAEWHQAREGRTDCRCISRADYRTGCPTAVHDAMQIWRCSEVPCRAGPAGTDRTEMEQGCPDGPDG